MGSMDKELTAAQARPRRSAASTGPSVEVETAASDEATADPYQPAQLTGTKRKGEQLGIRRSTESPLPPEEVRRLAESEGLPLIVAPTHTGFKGVSMVSSNGKNKTPLFALKINKKHAGSFPTAEQAALAYSRHIGREAAVVEAAAAQETMARRAAVQTPEGRDLTVAEVDAVAAAEGLTLKRSGCSASGFKDVAKAAHGGRFYYKAPHIRGWRLGTHGTPQAMALAIARQVRDVAAAAPPSAEAEAEAAVEGAAAEAAVEGAAAEVAVEMEVAAAGAAGACMDDAHQQLTATVPGTATALGTAPPAAVASAKRLAATATAAAAAAAKAEAKAERHVAALRAKLQAACEELQTASARALSTATQAAAAAQAAAEEKAAAVAQAIEAAQATGAAAADAERKAQLRDIAIEDVD